MAEIERTHCEDDFAAGTRNGQRVVLSLDTSIAAEIGKRLYDAAMKRKARVGDADVRVAAALLNLAEYQTSAPGR